jgi:hypothetical protein
MHGHLSNSCLYLNSGKLLHEASDCVLMFWILFVRIIKQLIQYKAMFNYFYTDYNSFVNFKKYLFDKLKAKYLFFGRIIWIVMTFDKRYGNK